jgi:hypothetical protein
MTGVMTMIVMLIVLVPLAILFAWAAVQDLKGRRRHALPVEVEARAATLKASSKAEMQTKYPRGHSGSGGI